MYILECPQNKVSMDIHLIRKAVVAVLGSYGFLQKMHRIVIWTDFFVALFFVYCVGLAIFAREKPKRYEKTAQLAACRRHPLIAFLNPHNLITP